MAKRVLAVILFVVSSLFLVSMYWVGPEYDESLYVNAALGCRDPEVFATVYWNKLGTCFPLMVSAYLGGLPALIYRLMFALAGVSVGSLRLVSLVGLWVVVASAYWVVKQITNRSTAAITSGLLLLDSSLYMELYKSVVMLPTALRLLSLGLLIAGWKGNRRVLIAAGGLMVGLAIWTKYDSMFFYLPLLFAILFVARPAFKQMASNLIWLGLGLAVGLLPLVYFLVRFFAPAITAIRAVGLMHSAEIGDKLKLMLFPSLAFSQYQAMFNLSLPILMFAVSAMLAIAFILTIYKSRNESKLNQTLVASLLFFSLIFLIVPSLGKSHHWLLSYPVPQTLVGIWLVRQVRKVKIIVFTALILFFVWQYAYFAMTAVTNCGSKNWSCGIYKLADSIVSAKSVVAYDWGMATQLELLTKGQKRIMEIVFDDQRVLQQKATMYAEKCLTFAAHDSDYVEFPKSVATVEAILDADAKYQKTRVYDTSWRESYVVYSCK